MNAAERASSGCSPPPSAAVCRSLCYFARAARHRLAACGCTAGPADHIAVRCPSSRPAVPRHKDAAAAARLPAHPRLRHRGRPSRLVPLLLLRPPQQGGARQAGAADLVPGAAECTSRCQAPPESRRAPTHTLARLLCSPSSAHQPTRPPTARPLVGSTTSTRLRTMTTSGRCRCRRTCGWRWQTCSRASSTPWSPRVRACQRSSLCV